MCPSRVTFLLRRKSLMVRHRYWFSGGDNGMFFVILTVNFSITIQHRFTILGPHSDHEVYISAICHLTLTKFSQSTDLVKFKYFFMIRLVSLLIYNLGSPYLVSFSINIQPRFTIFGQFLY